MKVYLTAIIQSKPEYTDEVLALLQNMVTQSRRETGCVQYDLHRDNADEILMYFMKYGKAKRYLSSTMRNLTLQLL